MTILLLIFVVLALVHLIYETIIAPTLRLRMKYRFFELRDRTVRLRLDEPEALPASLHDDLFDAIDGAMRYISGLSVVSIRRMVPMIPDEVRRRADERARAFDTAESADVRRIAYDLRSYLLLVLFINSLGLIITVAPIMAFFFTIQRNIETLAFKGVSRGDQKAHLASRPRRLAMQD